jgi:hypothetical protein
MTDQDWPWQAMGLLADRLYDELVEETKELMTASGEDWHDFELFRLRCAQIAFSVNARAEKARDR